jgi:ribose 5-phosphate isomerase RpiB
MKVGIATDHHGIEIKQELTNYLNELGYTVVNYGTDTTRNYISSTGVGLEFFHKGWYGKIALGVPLKDSEDNVHSSKTRTHFYLQRNI